jgi:hypothetical protein
VTRRHARALRGEITRRIGELLELPAAPPTEDDEA